VNRSAHTWAEIRAGGLTRGGAERAKGLMRGPDARAGAGMSTRGYTDINRRPCWGGHHAGSDTMHAGARGSSCMPVGVESTVDGREATGHRINPETHTREVRL
jgi:hypothetical protein